MAKQGMKRPQIHEGRKINEVSPVPEIQGKAKHGKEQAKPIIPGTGGAAQKVYHGQPFSPGYPGFFSDLARENLENDIPAADLQDL